MTPTTERRLLQASIAIACLVPLLAGGAGVLTGPSEIRGGAGAPIDVDSHFRYLSGLLLGIGLAFLSCVPRIETHAARLRLLAAIVVIGGLGRALSLATQGLPGPEHQFALVMELGVVPLVTVWQARVARRMRMRGA